jgi:cation:H+ antiporter
LPELATSAVAAYKKNADIAVGNVVGSNIFNIFFILGVTAVIHPIPFNVSSNIDLVVLILASIFLFMSMFTGKKRLIDRWEGILFVAVYIGFIWFKIAAR